MKHLLATRILKAALSLGICISSVFCVSTAYGQTNYKGSAIKTTLAGTSNIHDWVMISQKGSCNAVVMLQDGALTDISSLQFSMPAESLKSEHTQMDKNTYKALNTSKNPTISFTATSSSIKPNGKGYLINTKGKLTISGVTKDVDLVANGVVNADKSIHFTGSYKFKMTEFKVTPPSIMLGTIKVGDPLEVKYDFVLKTP